MLYLAGLLFIERVERLRVLTRSIQLLHSGTAIRLRSFWHIKLQRFSVVGIPTGLSECLDHLAFVHEQERLKTTRSFLIIRLGFDCWILALVSNGQEIFTIPTGDVAS